MIVRRHRRLLPLVAVAGLLLGAVAMPRAAGAEDAGPTPRVIRGPGATSATGEDDARLRWNELEPALAEAKRSGKPVIVDVFTDWCGWCKRMDKTTYGHPDVRDYVARAFVPARINAEDDKRRATYQGESRTYRQFADGFRISGYPTTLFLAADGSLITQLPGYVKPETFLTVLHYVGDGHYRTRSWDAYLRGQ